MRGKKQIAAVVLAVIFAVTAGMPHSTVYAEPDSTGNAQAADAAADDTQKEEKKEEKDLTANWPKEARELYKKRVEDDEAFKITIIGSLALGASEGGWAPQLKEALLSAYGDSIEVKIDEWDTGCAASTSRP